VAKIDLLDTLFSEYIRKRAMARVHGCERCFAGKTDYKQLQCSHFIGRTTKAVRWDEDNAAGLCPGCHIYLEHHPLEHVQWFKNYLGETDFNLLQARQRVRQKPDKAVLAIYYRRKVRELDAGHYDNDALRATNRPLF